MTEEEWYTVLAVSLSGAFFLSLAAICVLVIWLANRFPASPSTGRAQFRGTK